MKKYLFSIIFLLVSYLGFSQKGLSYQAVILDPNKIEVPGQDITGQPLVNGDVWMKFSIYNGTTLQFEEVQKTKTDDYGLVNLLIGSESTASFNSLVWDASQKTLQVHVSFNQGASYMKVSDQKLNYNPYALYAETAGKLGGVLGIAGGGTGATTAVAARAGLGLGNVENTSDAAKPISTATQTALDLKANSADLTSLTTTVNSNTASITANTNDIALKAPIASPTFTGTVSGISKSMVGLGSVDNTTDAAKPISTATQTALDLKANSADLTSLTTTVNSNTSSITANTNDIALKAPIASPTFTGTVSGISKSMVGLGSVDNTSDAAKPISTATQTALDLKANATDLTSLTNTVNSNTASITANTNDIALKAPIASPTFTGTVSGISKSMVGLGSVDNTSDAAKPISTATKAALDLKVNSSDVTTALALKANSADVNSALAAKVDSAFVLAKVAAATIADADASTKGKIQLAGDLAGTAAAPTVPGLALKANTADVTAALALKANSSDVNSALAAKVDSAFVLTKVAAATIADADTSTKGKIQLAGDLGGTAAAPTVPGLALKANTADVTVSLALKANSSDVNSALAAKVDSAFVLAKVAAATIADADTSTKGKIQLAGDLGGTAAAPTVPGLALKANTTDVNTALALKAPLASPALSGIPTAPTASAGTSTTQIATTEYTNAAISSALSSTLFSISTTLTSTVTNPLGFDPTLDSINYSGPLNVSTAQNLANGVDVLKVNQSGIANVGFGLANLFSNTTGNANTSVGYKGLYSNTSGRGNSSFGYYSLFNNTTGNANTANGGQSLFYNTTGGANTASGKFALFSNISANFNTATGYQALYANTTGGNNTATGATSLRSNTTGSSNTASGFGALFKNTTGSQNTANGEVALYSNTTGYSNTASGSFALYKNTTGANNMASGFYALFNNTEGSNNTASGKSALYSNTTGIENTAIGKNALITNTTGSNNTAIGSNADVASTNLSNATAIGYGASVSTSNTIQLGNADVRNVKTSGTITAGAVTYPNLDGSANQVLITNGNGVASFASIPTLNQNTTGTADNVTGVVAVANGGTGLTSAGTIGQVLTSTGSGILTWTTSTADAGTLTGATLNSTVTGSSLTSVGTLNSATVNGKVIVGASSAATASAVLEVSSTTQGFLPPRMSGAQRDAISSKVAGLVVWCSNCGSKGELQVFNGTEWTNIIGGTASVPLVVGATYQGGKIAYILQDRDPGYDPNIPHGIIAATSDQGRVKWNNNDFNTFTAVGAIGTAIGTGLANTIAIIENQGQSSSNAAGLARAHNGGQYADWYLPSKDELNKLYLNRVAIGGFALNEYWSSTEKGSTYAYLLDFSNGDIVYTGKDQSYRVRAIRTF